MIVLWRFINWRLPIFMVFMCFLFLNFRQCLSLNDEGLALLKFRERVVSDPFEALSNWKDDVGVTDPCSWFGVECSYGNVVVLDLKGLCLGGTLSPDLGSLTRIKSIILRNNSFYGVIPKEISELKELEVLDLGWNNFRGPLPDDLVHNLSLTNILLDNNKHFGSISPEIHELTMLSEIQVDENQLVNTAEGLACNRRPMSWNIPQTGVGAGRRLLQTVADPPPSEKFFLRVPDIPEPLIKPKPSPSPSPVFGSPSSSPSPSPVASISPPFTVSPPSVSPAKRHSTARKRSHSMRRHALILSAAIGGSALLLIFVLYIVLCQSNKVASVKPWATGLSGQLQKAFVTGVPKLRRSEIEIACEDFSNVISSSSIGSVYKGTLSSGVEIAVISLAVTFAKNWSKNLEAQFRKKIDTLSKVNHKNFVNLLGYCEEEEPFTRMMVFEYAPNGTLFEHLHIKEAEHLSWAMRIRIAIGIAYCLEHMHQLGPPVHYINVNSSSVHLTEDYAAKISDFGFSELGEAEMESNPECNIYSFGVILFEMITGRLPYSVDNGSLEDWASDYLRGEQPLREMVDPTLTSLDMEQLENIGEVMKSCVHPDPRRRPEMKEVVRRLRDITGIGVDGAIPRVSPLWWAELEILSTEAS